MQRYIIHEKCLKENPLNCSPTCFQTRVDSEFTHFWIEGNLRDNCSQCKISLVNFNILFGFTCRYCNIKYCAKCWIEKKNDSCDQGPLNYFKLSPTDTITNYSERISDWEFKFDLREPLFVFINCSSGNLAGKDLILKLNYILNPLQLIDLENKNPLKILTKLYESGQKYRILICGGDGTVSWILSVLDSFPKEEKFHVPPVAIIALGTGNDLSRALGWGSGYNNEDLNKILHDFLMGKVVLFDRWIINTIPFKGDALEPKYLNNYFSIGLDAKIALQFHNSRRANPKAFNSRIRNKMTYARLGFRCLFSGTRSISRFIDLIADGEVLTLPDNIESIVVLNIPNWAGGSLPWRRNAEKIFGPQKWNDKNFEIIGITGIIHIGFVQISLNEGIPLGQASELVIQWKSCAPALPVQLDGEPWMQKPALIKISFFVQSLMLVKN